jgi:hypothetical protein
MLTYEVVYKALDDFQKEKIDGLINEMIVTPNQLCQILIGTFRLTGQSDPVTVRSKIYFLIPVLNFLRDFLFVRKDEEQHKRAIKRLMATNGIDALNEILCHRGLISIFKNYKIRPLFLDDPDGSITDEENNIFIPVSIKSRIPRKITLLLDFFEKVEHRLPYYQDLAVFCAVTVEAIPELTDKVIEAQLASVEEYFQKVFHEKSGEFENRVFMNSSGFAIVVSLKTVRSVKAKSDFAQSAAIKLVLEGGPCPYKSVKTTVVEGGYLLNLIYEGKMSESLTQQISEQLFAGFFKHNNNLKEPRMFVFISENFGGLSFEEYISALFANYAARHHGTMLVGFVLEAGQEKDGYGIFVKYLSTGKDILETIKPYCKSQLLSSPFMKSSESQF